MDHLVHKQYIHEIPSLGYLVMAGDRKKSLKLANQGTITPL